MPARVSPPLASLGESAEGIYDSAKTSDWKKADDALATLKKSAQELSGQTSISQPNRTNLEGEIAKIQSGLQAHDSLTTMKHANQVTRFAALRSAEFHPKVPSEIALLDYYGRELQIWSTAKNFGNLQTTRLDMEQTWHEVRPSVVQHGGQSAAANFDELLKKLENAKTPNDYMSESSAILDEVDKLEKVFTP